MVDHLCVKKSTHLSRLRFKVFLMLACKTKILQGLCNNGLRASIHARWVGNYTHSVTKQFHFYADSMGGLGINENLRRVEYPKDS